MNHKDKSQNPIPNEIHTHEHSSCNCTHEHDTAHEHSACNCTHEHHNAHEHAACACTHEHNHSHEHKHVKSSAPYQIYILENLDCANCAAKMEQKLSELPDVEDVSITFATKQLRIATNNNVSLLETLQKICTSIEPEVQVIPKQNIRKPQNQEDMNVKKQLSENAKTGIILAAGAIFFLSGILMERIYNSSLANVLFIISYLILGGKIVLIAVKNLTKGHVFDENFLMSIATIGAFFIGDFAEAVGVMLFYRIGEFFEDVAVEKSRTQIMDAVDMRPEVVMLCVQDTTKTIPADEAKVGDLLLVRPGDRIPLDGVVMEGESRIDTSPVTGEPVPRKVEVGDCVTSGCVNTSGLLKIRVDKVLAESMVTRILDSVENAASSKPKIDRFITKFARIYTPFVVIAALCTAIIPSLVTGDWSKWIYTALTFLVISCPCALVLSVPLAFFSGIGAGSKKGILFKGGVSLEALNQVKAVVMDKTGTITKGNFLVQECIPVASYTKEQLLSYAASCELSSTHPIGTSIVNAAKAQHLTIEAPVSIKELSGRGIEATLMEGTLLCGNRKLMDACAIDLTSYENTQFGTEVLLALNGNFIGHILIADTLKEDAQSAITAIRKYGITTAMLTGDAMDSAHAIADTVGVDEVYAKLLPEEKLEKLQSIRDKRGAVMFVGDGINDAPVLAGADVGAAMGSGADAAIEAADVVFMSSKMTAILDSLRIARATNVIAKQNVIFALVIKALIMILGLFGFANMWMAVFADSGVAMLCVLNSIRILYKKN